MVGITFLGVLVYTTEVLKMTLQANPKEEIPPVFDASNNGMKFLGAVEIEAGLGDGRHSEVAFHVAERDEKEILLGTNALPGPRVRLTSK